MHVNDYYRDETEKISVRRQHPQRYNEKTTNDRTKGKVTSKFQNPMNSG